jgi:hypothetical protein
MESQNIERIKIAGNHCTNKNPMKLSIGLFSGLIKNRKKVIEQAKIPCSARISNIETAGKDIHYTTVAELDDRPSRRC